MRMIFTAFPITSARPRLPLGLVGKQSSRPQCPKAGFLIGNPPL
jgi:hypothetical protein